MFDAFVATGHFLASGRLFLAAGPQITQIFVDLVNSSSEIRNPHSESGFT
jgi:hypothetical protein